MDSRGLLNCDKFEDRIHQILDDRLTLTGDDLLMDHVSCCAKCEKILNAYDCIDASLIHLPVELADRLDQSEFRRGTVRRQAIASRPTLILASLAALILISVNVFHGLDNSSNAVVHHASQIGFVSPTVNQNFDYESEFKSGSAVTRPHQPAPDSSPFSPNFSIANSIPVMSLPSVPTWEDISDRFEPVLTYSARIPAVRPVYCSLNVTLDFLKRSLVKPDQDSKPDLGFSIEPNMLARA